MPDKWDEAYTHRATKGTAFAYLSEAYLIMKDYENALKAGLEVENSIMNYWMIQVEFFTLKKRIQRNHFSVGIAEGIDKYRRELYFGSKEDLGGDLGHLMRGDTYSADYFYPSKEFVDFSK